jgi:thiol:disulfide interchange protein DsbC
MKFIQTLATLALLTSFSIAAQDDVIRKNLSERFPKLPKIEEIQKAPIAGLFEIRVASNDVYYTDSGGNYLIDGQLIETKTGKNLTEERINKLSMIEFKNLPLQDAFVIKRGTGARKVAVFEDPNCGYCKRFEADMQKVNNVTFYMFLYPILGAPSVEKSNNIWCAADKNKAWTDWMLSDISPKQTKCNTDALARNVEFGKKHRITGTPTLLLADGTRVPGAIASAQLEKMLADVKAN